MTESPETSCWGRQAWKAQSGLVIIRIEKVSLSTALREPASRACKYKSILMETRHAWRSKNGAVLMSYLFRLMIYITIFFHAIPLRLIIRASLFVLQIGCSLHHGLWLKARFGCASLCGGDFENQKAIESAWFCSMSNPRSQLWWDTIFYQCILSTC